MESKQVVSDMNFPSWLTLLLVGLKLTGYIDWGWLMVFAPILLELGVALIVGVILAILESMGKG